MRRSLFGVLVTSLFLAALAQGQEAPGRARRLTVAAGPLLISQRDEQASPLRYSGAAPAVEIGYPVRTDRRWLTLRLGGAIGTLGSALTGDRERPRQQTWRAWLEVEYVRALSAADRRTRWFLGALVANQATVIHHFYADHRGSDAGYVFGTTALGPVIALERTTSESATLSAQLATSLFAVIARPYGSATIGLPAGGVRLHAAPVNVFQSARLTAAYTTELSSGAGIVLAYRVMAERYRDLEPFRSASQAMSLGVSMRLGGGR